MTAVLAAAATEAVDPSALNATALRNAMPMSTPVTPLMVIVRPVCSGPSCSVGMRVLLADTGAGLKPCTGQIGAPAREDSSVINPRYRPRSPASCTNFFSAISAPDVPLLLLSLAPMRSTVNRASVLPASRLLPALRGPAVLRCNLRYLEA